MEPAHEDRDRDEEQHRARDGGRRAEEPGPEEQEAEEQAAERIAVPRYDVVAATMEAIGEAIAGNPTEHRPGPEGPDDTEPGSASVEEAERPRPRPEDRDRQREEREEDRARMERNRNDLLIEEDIDETALPLEQLENPETRG
jgi:hypothetical protein